MEGKKRVYKFGGKTADGNSTMKNLLGGKGANLAEMSLIGIPVPAGFTITTEVCTEYNLYGKDAVVEVIKEQVEEAVKATELIMGAKFNPTDGSFPLLLSVRSGARASMPGMMNTVLNLGMNDETVKIIAEKSGNAKFAYDSYRRFIHMYGDVVMGVEAEEGHHNPFEVILDKLKEAKGYKIDTELTVEDLKDLVEGYKGVIREHAGIDFPTNPWDQLWGSVCAVFDSWNTERAILYRRMENIPSEWGTAVNVQAMVYGNMGDTSATGVCFSRDAATGEDQFNGEYLVNAQGEDVVSGVRTPLEITTIGSKRWAERNGTSEENRIKNFPSLEEVMPSLYKELNETQQKLEDHYKDMQDMEFTIQEGKLWMLQTRNGKRTGAAMVKMAVDMLAQGLIDEKTAVLRQEPNKLDELLHPVFDQDALVSAKVISKGLPASPGAATGQVVFSANVAEKWAADGKKVILVRRETSPEDLKGMYAAEGILTERGGMTSHAAVVARGMGKCCISSAAGVLVSSNSMTVNGVVYKEGDFISLDGTSGVVYDGKVDTMTATLDGDFAKLM
jgi:pyruvate,orthophosphate dikinase